MNASESLPEHEVVRGMERCPDTIMRELGHARMDLIKVDIEGAGYDVVGNLVAGGILPEQIPVEFPSWQDEAAAEHPRKHNEGRRRAGYRMVIRSPHRGDHALAKRGVCAAPATRETSTNFAHPPRDLLAQW